MTLYSFMVGSLFSLVWCLIALNLSLVRITPTTSLFPEIDFASKLLPGAGPSLQSIPPLPSSLSASNTVRVRRDLAGSQFFVRWKPPTKEAGGLQSGDDVDENVVEQNSEGPGKVNSSVRRWQIPSVTI